jgi:hypothetical protein
MTVILVDTGDLLFSRDSVLLPNAKQIGNLKADLYMKSYNLMGYDAFTPGELDLSFGVGDLIRMGQQAKFPFLAANLINVKSNETVFMPYLIKKTQGMKVGLFGLLSNRFPLGGPPEEKEKFRITDPIEAAKKAIGALKKRCRVIVALAHMEADEQAMLAEKVHGIHFIINGHLTHAQADPQLVHHTQIFLAGARGEFLGQVDLFRKKTRRLYSRYQLIPLRTDYSEKPEVQALVGQYKEELQCVLQTPARAELAEGTTPSAERTVPPLLSFVGEKGCETCHPREHQHWASTAHARAYQTLVEKEKTSDKSCLPCHTTGFGSQKEPGGRYENVQCESCHGPGEGHPDPWKELAEVDEHQCRQCHNATNSPNFDYDKYVQKILHPK